MTVPSELAGLDLDVLHTSAPSLEGVSGFVREPMTIADISALRGVVGYVPPGPGHPWLTVRLADGACVQIAPGDEERQFYLLEPADTISRRRGVQPQFLALWAAYRHLGKISLEALERASQLGVPDLGCKIAGLDVIEVAATDHTLPAIQLLAQLAAASNNRVRDGALSVAGDLNIARHPA